MQWELSKPNCELLPLFVLPKTDRPRLRRSVPVLSALLTQFICQFANFVAQKFQFELLCNPFVVNVKRAPVNIQMGQLEFQCNDSLEARYDFGECCTFSMLYFRSGASTLLHVFGSSTFVSSFSLWWWTTHTGVILFMHTYTSSWERTEPTLT